MSFLPLVLTVSACQPPNSSATAAANGSVVPPTVVPASQPDGNISNPASSQSDSRSDSQLNSQSNSQLTNQLTIYTSIDPSVIAPLFNDFSELTDVSLRLVYGQPHALVARLTREGKQTPADLVLTQDVGIFEQAVEASLLQPFSSEKALQRLPKRFYDPNDNWLALAYYARTAVYDSRMLSQNDLSSYANLAKPTWSQKLCLSQASHVPNLALVANLMHNLGDKRTLEALQGWVSNLAIPPVADDAALLQAVEQARCQVALVNSDTYARYLEQHPQTPVRLVWLNKGYGGTHINITGIAITRNAKHPELALSFIEWLSDTERRSLFASLTKSFPVVDGAEATGLLKSWGDIETSPIDISEYAEKQKLALDTLQQAGWQ